MPVTFLLPLLPCLLFGCFCAWFNDRYPETALTAAFVIMMTALSWMLVTTIGMDVLAGGS